MFYIPIPEMKQCGKCKEWKPTTTEHFKKRKDVKSGLRNDCRDCNRLRRRARYAANNEHEREKRRHYYAANGDRMREYCRTRTKKRPDVYSKIMRRWQQSHPDEVRIVVERRLARKRNLPDSFAVEQWRRCLDYFQYRCAACNRPHESGRTIAADHWIPLSSPECPGTVPENIVPLCHGKGGCNHSKSNADPLEWLTRKFGAEQAQATLDRVNAYFDWAREQDAHT